MKKFFVIVLLILVVNARYALGNYEYSQFGQVTEVFIIRGSGTQFMNFTLKFTLPLGLKLVGTAKKDEAIISQRRSREGLSTQTVKKGE